MYDLQGQFLFRKANFHTITCIILYYDFKTNLTCCEVWKLILLNVSVTYSASYVWVSNAVGLHGSSHDTALRLWGEALHYKYLKQHNKNGHWTFYYETAVFPISLGWNSMNYTVKSIFLWLDSTIITAFSHCRNPIPKSYHKSLSHYWPWHAFNSFSQA